MPLPPPEAVIVAIPELNVTSSPVPKLTVVADPIFELSSRIATPVPTAVTLRSAEPSIAGNVPVSCAAGRFVRLDPDPENDDAVATPETFKVSREVFPLTVRALIGFVVPIPTLDSV